MDRSKTIFIHIGFGKTGTSSVQEFFFINRKVFEEQGLQYPTTGLTPYAHHGLAQFQSTKMPVRIQNLFLDLLEEIAVNSCNKILISSEQFCFLKKPYVVKLKELLAGFQVKVIFYVRPQLRLIESTFLEWQKSGMDYKGSIDDFYKHAKRGFDFSQRLKPWVDVFGSDSITVRVYDKKVIGESTCLDMMNILGLKYNSDVKNINIRSNLSILPEFSAILGLVDKAKITNRPRKEIVDELISLSAKFEEVSTSALISGQLKIEIESFFKDSNQSIAREFINEADSLVFLGSNIRRLIHEECQAP